MYGAIIGDIVGSRFEFDRPGWTKDFELFTDDTEFTDDSVLTIAILEALIKCGQGSSIEEIKKNCIERMQYWGKKYPNAGYGVRFADWVMSSNPEPYNSFGNGSAMRVSAAGFLYNSLDRTREVARATAEVSHNHPEGIKGAECTAAVIYLGRIGKAKEEIRKYVIDEFGYDIDHTVEELIPQHKHDETCMDSLPKALVAFFDGNSFEDVIRNAVALGGDTDTIAAIAGGMAEGFYGIPRNLKDKAISMLDSELVDVLNKYEGVRVYFAGALQLNKAISICKKQTDENAKNQAIFAVINILISLVKAKVQFPTVFVNVGDYLLQNTKDHKIKPEDFFKLKESNILQLGCIKDPNQKNWVPLFTTMEEMTRRNTPPIAMDCTVEEIIRKTYANNQVEGVVINPFGNSMVITKPLMQIILEAVDKK